LVSREAGVPMREEGSDQLSLDHLFLDQDAIPTLVEVKRSSDTRIRREVVGQMLDYASNAVAYWTEASLRARFEARCEADGTDPAQAVAEFLEAESEADADADVEAFWAQVRTNLQAGRIRLLFVADEIPPELRRIVEFLNRFMDPVQVLAVEVPQYVGQGLKTLVPRLIGQTTETQAKSEGNRTPRRQWDETSFFQDLEERKGSEAARVARRLLDWIRPRVTDIYWGKRSQDGAYRPYLVHKETRHPLFVVYSHGRIKINFSYYKSKEPFRSEEKRLELMTRLNEIQGISLTEADIERRPSIPLSVFTGEKAIAQLLEALEWAIGEIKAT
jgi:hypothetical protein